MPQNFSFLIDGQLCAMERPGSFARLEEDLAFLEQQGVRALVDLTERCFDPVVLEGYGFDSLHLPVSDFTAPEIEQCLTFVRKVDEWLKANKPVAVHCAAGYGRSGTMLAAYLVWQGLSSAKAVERVREARPMSIETAAQEARVREFEHHLKKKRLRRKGHP